MNENNNELKHYGVVGMKWGHRKARYYEGGNTTRRDVRQANKEYNKAFNKMYNSANRANFTIGKKRRAAANARYEKDFESAVNSANKANKTTQQYKAQKAKNKLDSKTTKKTQDYVNKTSTGKAIVQQILLGGYGSIVYSSARARSVSRGKAAFQAIANESLNNLTFGLASRNKKW